MGGSGCAPAVVGGGSTLRNPNERETKERAVRGRDGSKEMKRNNPKAGLTQGKGMGPTRKCITSFKTKVYDPKLP